MAMRLAAGVTRPAEPITVDVIENRARRIHDRVMSLAGLAEAIGDRLNGAVPRPVSTQNAEPPKSGLVERIIDEQEAAERETDRLGEALDRIARAVSQNLNPPAQDTSR